MSTTTIPSNQLEFRCTRCWRSNLADVSQSGASVECQACGEEILVPEASVDRIARAQALLANELSHDVAVPKLELDKVYTNQELLKIANEEAKKTSVPLKKMDFSGYPPAPLTRRAFAYIIDQLLMVTAWFCGILLSAGMAKLGVCASFVDFDDYSDGMKVSSLILVSSIPISLGICQWILLSTLGQTVGKCLMWVRIVGMSGRVPGFLQVVVLRNWVRNLLAFIPFFSQIDFLFAFGASGRSLHDWISGTRVVEVL